MDLVLPTITELSNELSKLNLDGTNGSNRHLLSECRISASNDYEAIYCWLNEYKHKETTFRTYQKEAERLLLWSVFQCRKSLSSLDRNDFEIYFTFLDKPEPKSLWCARDQGGGRRRGDPGWKPFIGGLSHSAKRTAISSIDSLFNYLVEACYLKFNPLSLIRKKYSRNITANNPIAVQERMLTVDEWHAMLDTMDTWPDSTELERQEKARLIFIVNILYFLGLRISELVTHHWNAFRKIDDEWWFCVVGKGDKPGMIPVCDELLKAIIIHRSSLQKSPYPSTDENVPLITAIKSDRSITPRYVNKILKALALETAKKFAGDPAKIEKLGNFSAHWLRHLSASMQDRAGIAFKHIRSNHRHENDETTRRYIHAIDRERHHDMQKLTLRLWK